ncbi:YncE family protein [Nocardia sp. NPDC059240]|uniref:YncE family protein n=1 Tax=Nocardia sp. NPDC059240 TaxID=3346786 RepID=UPI0036B0A57B
MTAALAGTDGAAWPLRLDDAAAMAAAVNQPTAGPDAVAGVLRAVVARTQPESGVRPLAGLTLTYPQRWTAERVRVLSDAVVAAGYPLDKLQLQARAGETAPAAAGFATSSPVTARSTHRTWLIGAAAALLVASAVTGVVALSSGGAHTDHASDKPNFPTIAVGDTQGVGYTVVDSVNHRVFTSDTSSNTVSVVDTQIGQTVAKVPIGASPRALAVDSQARTLWVIGGQLQDGIALLKIDTTTNTVVGTAKVPNSTRQIAVYPPTHEVYASQANGDVLDRATGAQLVASIVDPVSLQVTGSVGGQGHGVDVAVDPDRGLVYLAGGRNVKIVDPTTKSVVRQIDSPLDGELMVVDPRTNTAFMSVDTKLAMFDLTNGTYLGALDVGHKAFWLAIDPVLGTVYAPDSYGPGGVTPVTVIDIASRTIKGNFSVAGGIEGLGADPVSHKLYVRPMRSYLDVVDPCQSIACH